jgi:hypothetical protein
MKRTEKMAVGSLILSCGFYATLFGVPFLSVDLTTKAAISGGLVVAGEGAFWLGAAIAGREVMRRYRRWLWPSSWFESSP